MAGRPLDGDSPKWPGSYADVPLIVRNEVEARAAVRLNRRAAASYIKLYGGLAPEAMSAAIDEAHHLGMKTAADLLEWSSNPEVAVRMGIDALEHGIPTVQEASLPSLLRLMKTQHTALTSTMVLLGPVTGQPVEKSTFRALPSALQKRAHQMVSEANLPAWVGPRRNYWCKSVARFAQDGGFVMAGTDSYWLASYPGDVHEELQQLVTCGLSPLQALQAATLNPAEWLGLTDLGNIEPGNRADLLILEASPLAAIGNTRTDSAVVLGGHYLDRGALDALIPLASEPAPKR